MSALRASRANEYPPGTRVRLVEWAPSPQTEAAIPGFSEYANVPRGTCGECGVPDDAGTIFVKWDNGSTLGFTTNDKVEKLNANP